MQTAVLVLSAVCALLAVTTVHAVLYAQLIKREAQRQKQAHKEQYDARGTRLLDLDYAMTKVQSDLAAERHLVRMMLAASAPTAVAAAVGYQPAVERVEQTKAAQDLNDILLSRGG
jgi:hypothetical protein